MVKFYDNDISVVSGITQKTENSYRGILATGREKSET